MLSFSDTCANAKALILDHISHDVFQLNNIKKSYIIDTGNLTLYTSYNLNPEDCIAYPQKSGFCYIEIIGTETIGRSEEPLYPMKVIPVELPPNAKICGVKIISGKYREINAMTESRKILSRTKAGTADRDLPSMAYLIYCRNQANRAFLNFLFGPTCFIKIGATAFSLV